MTRIRAVLVGAALAGLAAVALAPSPVSADVSVEPAVAPRGGPTELTFRITEERPGAHTTKITLIPPAATPIAEVYPLSVPGWAPATAYRKLDEPVELIHGAQTTSIVESVTWTRSPKATTSGDAQLAVALGPMPQTDTTTFTIVQTYSDGTVVRWGEGGKPGPMVQLVDAPTVAGHNHGTTASDAGGQEVVVEEVAGGQPWLLWILGGALLLGLAFTAEGLAFVAVERRQRTA